MQNKAMTARTGPAELIPAAYSRTSEVADHIGVTPRMVRDWAKAGKIPAPIEVNGFKLFKTAEIQDWLKAKQEG